MGNNKSKQKKALQHNNNTPSPQVVTENNNNGTSTPLVVQVVNEQNTRNDTIQVTETSNNTKNDTPTPIQITENTNNIKNNESTPVQITETKNDVTQEPETNNEIKPIQITQVTGGTFVGGVSLKYIIELAKELSDDATMTEFVKLVLKPATLERKESFLLKLAREQPDKVKPVADVFISYTWGYKINSELLAALKHTLLYKSGESDVFVWLDGFCVNQHQVSSTTVVDHKLLQQTFGEALKAIGKVAMVLVNWRNPSYQKRIWCVFEVLQSKVHDIPALLAMSKKEEENLVRAMIRNEIDAFFLNDLFSSVDVESAKARESADQAAILQLIREYGVADVNTVVLGNLKAWIVQGGELALKSVEVDSKEAASVCGARSEIHATLGEFESALEWVEKSLNIYIKVYGPVHRYVATAYGNKTASLTELGRLDEALVANDQDLAICIKLLGVDDPDTITSREWKANILQAQGKLEEALVIRNEVLESRRRVSGENELDTASAIELKANCLRELKRYDEALPLYEQALTTTRSNGVDESNPTYAESYDNKALCLTEMGRATEALPLYDQILATAMKVLGLEDPYTAKWLHNKALCLHALGRIDEAKMIGKQALGIRERKLGVNHRDTMKSRRMWGDDGV
jgi:tetratricopeptide (TPR) repeat protein